MRAQAAVEQRYVPVRSHTRPVDGTPPRTVAIQQKVVCCNCCGDIVSRSEHKPHGLARADVLDYNPQRWEGACERPKHSNQELWLPRKHVNICVHDLACNARQA